MLNNSRHHFKSTTLSCPFHLASDQKASDHPMKLLAVTLISTDETSTHIETPQETKRMIQFNGDE